MSYSNSLVVGCDVDVTVVSVTVVSVGVVVRVGVVSVTVVSVVVVGPAATTDNCIFLYCMELLSTYKTNV